MYGCESIGTRLPPGMPCTRKHANSDQMTTHTYTQHKKLNEDEHNTFKNILSKCADIRAHTASNR